MPEHNSGVPEHNSGMLPEHNSGVPENHDVEFCRIYEVSENVVEKGCRIKSKNVIESSRNL